MSKLKLEQDTGGVVSILMRLGMTGGLASQLISGLEETLPGAKNVFPLVLDVLLSVECPEGVGNPVSKLKLELGTEGVVSILMRQEMTGGLASQLFSGLVGTLPGAKNVFPLVLDALLDVECSVGVGNPASKLKLELGTGGVV